MAYRRGALFVRDPREHCRPIDRNARARIIFLAERLDRSTKEKGRRNGQLGYVGLAILKALMTVFHNSKTGLCCPGYDAIQHVTGLCRGAVAEGVRRLERSGLVTITRRLVRVVIDGMPVTRQGTNLYLINDTARVAPPLPARQPRVPRAGSIGAIASAALARAESTGEAGTLKGAAEQLKTYVTPAHDWRARARASLHQARR